MTLALIGLMFQGLGVLLTLLGLLTTWREFAREGEQPLRWLAKRLQASVRALRTLAGSIALLGRPRPTTFGAASSTSSSASASLRVHVGYGALPTGSEEAIAELDRRTRQLMEVAAAIGERLSAEVGDLKAATEALRHDLDKTISELDRQTQRAALSGIRLEALGLFFIAVGIFLQAWDMALRS